jgi:hypothetical protein
LSYFKINKFARITKLPPIIVKRDSEGKKNKLMIIEAMISEYERITILPPLSFFTPIL